MSSDTASTPAPTPASASASTSRAPRARTAGHGLARELPGWLREARALAAEHGLDSVAAAFESLAQQRGRPAFRIAVVGEFNRGKSTLINTLIDRRLLPVGKLPTTGHEVAVRGVEQGESLRLIFPDGRRLARRLETPGAWDGLLVDGSDAAAPSTAPSTAADAPAPAADRADGPLTAVAEVCGSWLTGRDLELVDTAGANRSGREPAEEGMRQTVNAADAALFVISALSPLTITERQLLEEELLCRHLPHIAVVVTMLDQVEPSEREEILADLHKRLAALPGRGTVPILPAPAPGGDGAERDVLRSLLENWADEAGRGRWRDRRIAANAADHCDAMAQLANEAVAAARLGEDERRRQTLQDEAERAEDEQLWRELRIELDARRLEHARDLRGLLLKERDGVLEYLREDLRRTPDPAGWWERELPAQIRRHLAVTASAAERAVSARLAVDTDWLDAEIRRRLPGAQPSPSPGGIGLQAPAAGAAAGTAAAAGAAPLADLSRFRLAARVGAQGGSALGYLVATARRARLPMIYTIGFSVVGGLLAEAAIRSATEAQRRRVDMLLVQTVDESVGGFAEQAATMLASLYDDVIEHFEALHRVSAGARRELAAGAGAAQDAADWSDLAVAAGTLAGRIRGALERSATDHTEGGD